MIRRLTVEEYIETVRRQTGVEIGSKARQTLPSEVQADGFRNTAYSLTVGLEHIKGYSTLAGTIVDRLEAAEYVSSYVDCNKLERACFRKIIDRVGRRLFRGPVRDAERKRLLGVYEAVVDENGTFEEAVSYVLEAMLQSPSFIYRIEDQRGDGSAQHVDGYELASRLSYFIWSGPPDQTLMEAAENGELSEPEQLTEQVERMLEDPRADKSVRRFITDWLSLGRLKSLAPNKEQHPGWSDQLASDMKKETLAFVEHVLREQGRPMPDLFDAQMSFLTPALARHYGLEPKGEGRTRYDLSDVPERGGLLTQGSVLTIGGGGASTVSRGLFVLEEVLCGEVNSPPPDVDTTPVPAKPGQSKREIAESRISNPKCGGCHTKFEPLSFGLSKFNGVGKYVEVDRHGNELRSDGTLVFPGDAESVDYENSAEMMKLLADSDRVGKCMTRKVAQFALGRKLREGDTCHLEKMRYRFRKGGKTYASLVAAVATSDLFTTKQTVEGTNE